MTNDFKPIATGGGANVETQIAYVADPVVPIGFGVNAAPPSSLWNKMMRQASVITSQFAQMVCDYSGLDMLDDGNLATMLTTMKTQFRIRIQANTTFYVRADGNDANSGLVNNAGGAWLTLQHAQNAIAALYDLNGYQATIKIGAGTFAGATFTFLTGQTSSLIVDGVGAATIISSILSPTLHANVSFTNMKLVSSGDGIAVSGGAIANVSGAGMEYGACVGAHLYANNGTINVGAGNYTISGGAAAHYQAFNYGRIIFGAGPAVVVSGTPAFSTAFCNINQASMFNGGSAGLSFVGGATGIRYAIDNLSFIFTNTGASATFFPGNIAGVNNGHGAQYN